MSTAHTSVGFPAVPRRMMRRQHTAPRPITPAVRVVRSLIAVVLLGAIGFGFLNEIAFRAEEAKILSSWLTLLLPGGVAPNGTHFLIYLPGHVLIAFDITMECTGLLIVSPLIALGAAMLIFTRVKMLRVFAALAASTAIAFAINQLRLGVIAWTTQTWGMDFGFQIGHRFIGSLIALVGFGIGFLIILWVTLKSRTRSRPDRAQP